MKILVNPWFIIVNPWFPHIGDIERKGHGPMITVFGKRNISTLNPLDKAICDLRWGPQLFLGKLVTDPAELVRHCW